MCIFGHEKVGRVFVVGGGGNSDTNLCANKKEKLPSLLAFMLHISCRRQSPKVIKNIRLNPEIVPLFLSSMPISMLAIQTVLCVISRVKCISYIGNVS